jgi:hypothetical protein
MHSCTAYGKFCTQVAMVQLVMGHKTVAIRAMPTLNSELCLIFMDPCIIDDSVEIPTRCSFVIEFIISKFIEGSTCFKLHTVHHQEL